MGSVLHGADSFYMGRFEGLYRHTHKYGANRTNVLSNSLLPPYYTNISGRTHRFVREFLAKSQNHSLSIPYPVLVPVLVGSGANFGPRTRYPVSWYPYSIGAGVTCVGRVRFSAQILVPV